MIYVIYVIGVIKVILQQALQRCGKYLWTTIARLFVLYPCFIRALSVLYLLSTY